MKRILFYIEGIYQGGTEMALLRLAEKLSNQYELYINYTNIERSNKELTAKILKFCKFISINEKFEVDAVIYCTEANKQIDTIMKNITYKKSYFWFHYFEQSQELFLNRVIEEDLVEQVITVGETVKNILLDMPCLKNKKDKIDVIKNVIDVNEVIDKSKEDCDIQLSKTLNLITVARYSPVKGYERVKALADELIKRDIDFKWFVLGNGNNEEYNKKVINMLMEYPDKFVLLGYQENPFKFVKKCDYNVLLSQREVMPLVILEAKILGVPTIASDFPSAFELIEEDKDGIILSREKTDTYKDYIDKILENKEKYKKELVGYEYNIDEIMNKWKQKI